MEKRTEYVLRLTLDEVDARALTEAFNGMTALPSAVLDFNETLAEFMEKVYGEL